MPKDKPLSIAFNVTFDEAIAAAKARQVVLPDVYYGELQGIARQKAFSIAGITATDQLQAVLDSLNKALADGQSFNDWKKQQAIADLALPKHRLDNIWRTNLQGQYMAGKWEQFERNQENRPYLMYDAINDSRVRPSHLAMDGKIWHIDDPQVATHSPPCGYRCRCSLISLSESQAQARSNGFDKGLHKRLVTPDGQTAGPDKGWEYSKRDRMAGVEKAIQEKQSKLSPALAKALSGKLDESAKIPAMELNHEAFKRWAEKVTAIDYKARHEFMSVGTLPGFVLKDADVAALKPISDEIHISDHQLRHSIRDIKAKRNAALPIEVIAELPSYLRNARWFYDSKHKNICAVFDAKNDVTGKSVIHINFEKGKILRNAVVTSGIIDACDMNNAALFREIKFT